MSRSTLMCPLLLLALTATAAAQRVDRHGDALPDGAIARIGSTRFRHDAPLGRVHYSGDGKALIGEGAGWNGYDKATRIWDADTGKPLPQFHGKALGSGPLFSPGGKFLVDYNEGAARLWDVAAGKVVRTWGGAASREKQEGFNVSWPSFSDDGKILVILGTQGDKEVLRRFDLKTGAELRRHEMATEFFGPYGLLSPNGRSLLADMEAKDDKRSFFLVNLDTGKKLHAFEDSSEPSYWWGKDFSPDGKLLIAGAEEREILIWNVATGKLLHKLQNGKAGFRLRTPAFSPDGKLFMVNHGLDHNVMIYEAATGKLLHTLSNGGMLNRCVFSPDSKRLLTPSNTEITVWDVAAGHKVCRFDFACAPDGPEAAAAYSPDGKRIAYTDDRLLRVGDIATGKLLHDEEGSHFMPTAFVFSQDGKVLTIRNSAGDFHAWDATAGKHIKEFDREDRWSARPGSAPLGFPRDGKILAALNGLEYLSIWDIRANKEVQSFDDDIWCWSRHSAFSTDARLVATTSRNGEIHVFDIASGKWLHRFHWYTQPFDIQKHWHENCPMLAFSPDGRSLAALGHPKRPLVTQDKPNARVVRIWELATGKERHQFQLDDPSGAGLTWTPDSKSLAILGGDVVLVSVATGKELRRFSAPGGLHGNLAVFTNDGKLLAAPDSTGKVRVWETAAATLLCEFRCHSDQATLLAFSPDGKRLATAGSDATVLIWDVDTFLKRGAADPKQLEAAWHALADADAGKAFAAITVLTEHSREATALLKERLKPPVLPDPKRLKQLLLDLDNAQFAVRQMAARELDMLDDLAEPGLKKALTAATNVEMRRRLEEVLDKIAERPPSPRLLQSLRAIEALERIGSAEARALLQALARSMPGHRTADAAAATLERLAK